MNPKNDLRKEWRSKLYKARSNDLKQEKNTELISGQEKVISKTKY